MSEIERAIETLEKQDFGLLFVRMDDGSAYALDVAVETAIVALKEKLEREKNAPLTAEQLAEMVDSPIFVVYKSTLGATIVRKWSIPYMVHEGTAHCTDGENWYPAPNCHIYRYEPKGEKA